MAVNAAEKELELHRRVIEWTKLLFFFKREK
jgi:hypothetical protein